MPTDVLLGMAVAWLLTGIITGYVMRRRGHDFFVWLSLGSVLGPLVVPIAVESARSVRAAVRQERSQPKSLSAGLDLLMGIDGSADAISAAAEAIEMLGEVATGVTLATVLDYEARSSSTGKEDRAEAQRRLEETAEKLGYPGIETAVLFGKPDLALADYAQANGIEMIVVGPRGQGRSEPLFGSVTKSLVGAGSVPVLVGRRSTNVDSSAPPD